MYISIGNIKKRFGSKNVLCGVDLECEKGQAVAILGINGSGKSTFFNVLAGISSCDAGTFAVDGIDMFKNKCERSKRVGYVTQNPPLIDELTALDNLKLWYGKKALKEELEGGVLKLLGVNEFLKVRVNKMSGGMKKRLAICLAVAHKPDVIFLDEPTAALDLPCKQNIYEYLIEFKKQGGTVLIATHDLQDLPLCEKTVIFKNGKAVNYDYNGDGNALIGNL